MPTFSTDTTRDRLVADLKQVIASAEELLTATANQSGEAINAARERAESSLKHARRKVAELEDAVVHRAKDAVDTGEAQIKAHPWTAVGVSAGIGLLLGLLIGRR